VSAADPGSAGSGSPAGPGRSLAILVAPDSFKGSLTSVEVARALAAGWLAARPGDEIRLAPLADGGEGTAVALDAAGGWEWRAAAAHDPLGRAIDVRWLASADGTRAVVELAAASGLSRLAPAERDPAGASTYGTGEVLQAVLAAGIRRIDLGVGGSATTDGGLGILAALGLGLSVDPALEVHLDELDQRLAEVDLRIASDVTNPLLGPTGAAAVYGPQKGASAVDVRNLDAALGHWADALEAATGRDERNTPGAGAAGGTVFGLACLRDRFRLFAIVPGIDLVMEAWLRRPWRRLVVTGRAGSTGRQPFVRPPRGRVGRGAGVRASRCGGVEPDSIAARRRRSAGVLVVERLQSVEEAMAAGLAPSNAAERLARLVGLGMT
jgi:glycerate kinase